MTDEHVLKTAVAVDDCYMILDYLNDVFQRSLPGVELRTYSDPEKASEDIFKLQPDIVITDWSMPRLNGGALARRLRGVSYKGIIVLFSSDLSQAGYNRKSDSLFNAFVDKSEPYWVFVDRIRKLLFPPKEN